MTEEDNPLFGSLSHAEQSMGQEAYQVNVKVSEAMVEVNKAVASKQLAFAQVTSAIGGVITFGVFMASLPCIVWLWRWAV